ncbi:MAG: undecaprenyl-diphosphate phosphatase [Lentisphaerales bacterium]|nr:MAG: undecaprenyl-diphosphate phosphatase [Lentisphaerales bacterium]
MQFGTRKRRPLLCAALVAVALAGSFCSAAAEAEAHVTPVAAIHMREAATLAVVEGLTEYLPISSTGHMILVGHLMKLTVFGRDRSWLGREVIKSPAVDAYEIVIQLGAVLAVLGLYRKRVAQIGLGLLGQNKAGLRLAGLLAVAFLPAAVTGLLLHGAIKRHLFGPIPVAAALIIGGIVMIIAERSCTRRATAPSTGLDSVTWRQAAIIGVAQCLAMWPGMSRSMVTIVAGLLAGLNIVTSAKFSFLLALPTLGSATLYEAVRSGPQLLEFAGPGVVLVGLIISGAVAALSVRGFVKWLTGHGMWPFGIYRVILGAAVLILI